MSHYYSVLLLRLVTIIIIPIFCIRKLITISKYEFDNRTNGGVVTHNNYWGAQRQHWEKKLYLLILGIYATAITLFGISYLLRLSIL